MAGVDPAIHAVPSYTLAADMEHVPAAMAIIPVNWQHLFPPNRVDGRIKSGHDSCAGGIS